MKCFGSILHSRRSYTHPAQSCVLSALLFLRILNTKQTSDRYQPPRNDCKQSVPFPKCRNAGPKTLEPRARHQDCARLRFARTVLRTPRQEESKRFLKQPRKTQLDSYPRALTSRYKSIKPRSNTTRCKGGYSELCF